MELQLRIAKPVAEFGDLRAVAIIQMLAGAEDLHQRNARVPDPLEPDRGQAVVDEQMSGERAMHIGAIKYPAALPTAAAVGRRL